MKKYFFPILLSGCGGVCFVLPVLTQASTESVLISASFDVAKCVTTAGAVSCDPIVPVSKNVEILLSRCSSTPVGSVCSGSWTALTTRDGYYFDVSIAVTKAIDSAGIASYHLTASVGPTMNGISIPHSAIDIYMNQGRLTDFVQFASAPLNVGTIGPAGTSSKYTPSLLMGPAVFH